ncbi:MAG: DUF6027 family protein [Acidobacteriota bacterium]|nr:DUF6027 family protein [Acidobacteriota bacterium]
MPTLSNLSALTGVPVEKLVRYVLVKWTASGSEALLAMRPIVFQQMQDHVARAEREGTDNAKLGAYEALRKMISWLNAGTESTRPVHEDHVEHQNKDADRG